MSDDVCLPAGEMSALTAPGDDRFPECVNLLAATCEGPEQSSITSQFR